MTRPINNTQLSGKYTDRYHVLGLCYVDGFKTEENGIIGLQTDPKKTYDKIFNVNGVIQLRYLGYYVPFKDKTYKYIYYIYVLTD